MGFSFEMSIYNNGVTRITYASVAQLDRVLPSGGRGQGFESLRARENLLFLSHFQNHWFCALCTVL